MKVVIASLNPVKMGAVEQAFRSQFPEAALELTPIEAESGVGDQPMSDQETRQGAVNRACGARQMHPDADYWVGLEGGLEWIGGHLLAFAWMAIAGPAGRLSAVRSTTLPLPPAVEELVNNGMELGEANDRVFATVNSKQGGGAFGLLTGGLLTRESVYRDTLVLALVWALAPYGHLEAWQRWRQHDDGKARVYELRSRYLLGAALGWVLIWLVLM